MRDLEEDICEERSREASVSEGLSQERVTVGVR